MNQRTRFLLLLAIDALALPVLSVLAVSSPLITIVVASILIVVHPVLLWSLAPVQKTADEP